MTDADCLPASSQWIRKMVRNFDVGTNIVLGYAPYNENVKNYFLNITVQYETIFTAIQYLSFALIGMPYMGVGRNLAYEKSLFTNSNGFDQHANLPSGDDDLFINQVASGQNTQIEIDPETFCFSAPPQTWKEWFRQKTRHYQTGSRYRPVHLMTLGIYAFSHLFFYILLFLLILNGDKLSEVLILYTIRLSLVLFVWKKFATLFEDKRILYWIPLVDGLYCLIYLVMYPISFLNQNVKWK